MPNELRIIPLVILIWIIIILTILLVKRISEEKREKRYKPYQKTKYKKNRNPFPEIQKNQYKAKKSLMTNCEQAFFEAIKMVTPTNYYIVQPQINLASVIEVTNEHKYQNELFRNIDFGIFDRNYKIAALIEINDKSHEEPERIARDKRVKEICKEANIPLITFWTKYGINPEYIERRVRDALAQQKLN